MKNLDVSSISNSLAMPVKSGTLAFLQLAYQEALTAIANNLIGANANSSNTYILYGCQLSGTGPYNIAAGAVYNNGTVYLVDATTGITLTGSQVIVGTIGITHYTTDPVNPALFNGTADPVIFSDNNYYYVHNVSKMVFAAGTSGSGVADFDNLKTCGLGLLNDQQGSTYSSGGTYTVKFDQDRVAFLGGVSGNLTFNFDLTDAVPGAVVRVKFQLGAYSVTVTTGSGQTALLDSGDLSACASATNTLYFIYVGQNDSGNSEISYSINQPS